MADQEGLHSQSIHHEKGEGSHWGDALQQADSDAAIESFQRCALVEIWPFLWCAIYLP